MPFDPTPAPPPYYDVVALRMFKAAEILEYRGWTQDEPYSFRDGLCVEGAIAAATFGMPLVVKMQSGPVAAYQPEVDEARRTIREVAKRLRVAQIADWNDAEDRTADECIDRLRACACNDTHQDVVGFDFFPLTKRDGIMILSYEEAGSMMFPVMSALPKTKVHYGPSMYFKFKEPLPIANVKGDEGEAVKFTHSYDFVYHTGSIDGHDETFDWKAMKELVTA